MAESLKRRQPATVKYILDRAMNVARGRKQSAHILGGVGKTHVLELLREKATLSIMSWKTKEEELEGEENTRRRGTDGIQRTQNEIEKQNEEGNAPAAAPEIAPQEISCLWALAVVPALPQPNHSSRPSRPSFQVVAA
jgi:hypothetical protein